MNRDKLIAFSVTTVVIACIISIPTGFGLWLYTGDSRWLLMCIPIVIFLG